MMVVETDQWLTPAQAGRLLDVTPAYIRQLADAKRIRSRRTPLGRLLDPEDVKRFAAERAQRQRPITPTAA